MLHVILLLTSIVWVPALFILLGSGLMFLFTGKTPKRLAYEREVRKREEQIQRGVYDGRLNRDAVANYQSRNR
jgi:hypothetical protein